MRLIRLGLTRYGIFTDHVLDFGETGQGKPDLHYVYGANESGKSTALSGYLDLLFAFEHRSPYGFAHGYQAMQVEADLSIEGITRRFVRVRKREGSLLDASGTAVSDGVIMNALGGMNRETYRAMFSLDDHTLEAGGEEILRSEGDLGRLLFGTGAGLVELSRTLGKLRDSARDFYKPRSRSTELHKLRRELDKITQEKKELDMAASAFSRLVTKRDAARVAYDEAMALHANLEANRQDALRRVNGLRRMADMRPLRAEFADLADLPNVPEVWFTQIGDLIAEMPMLTERVKGLRSQKRKLNEERDALNLDYSILDLEDRLNQLERTRARYVTAEEDLPRRRASLAEHDNTIAAIIRRLDKAPNTDPQSLIVPISTVGVLTELIETRSGIDERLRATEQEKESAKSALESAKNALDASSEGIDIEDDTAQHLRNLVDEIQSEDFATRLDLHTRRHESLQVELDAQLAQLRPWNGEAEALAGVHVPEQEELEAWGTTLDEAGKEIERIRHDGVRHQAEQRRLLALMNRRGAQTGVIGDETAERIRKQRNDAWQRHRDQLDIESANTFEERLKKDDAATTSRIEQAATLAELRQASETLRHVEAEIERGEAELTLAQSKQQETLDRIGSAVAEISSSGADDLPQDTSLHKLTGWMSRRMDILDTLREMHLEDVEILRARQEAEQFRERLAGVLAATGHSQDADARFDVLFREARHLLANHNESRAALAAASQRLDLAQEELDRREQNARQAIVDDAAWRDDWTAALSGCWLATVNSAPPTAAVPRILEDVAMLETTLSKRNAMSERVDRMDRDLAAHSQEVQSLIESLDGEFDPRQPVAQGDGLRTRLASAIANRSRREEVGSRIVTLSEEIATHQSALSELQAIATEMFETFGVDSLRDVNARLQESARREELRKDLEKREAGLVEAMNAASLDEAQAAISEESSEGLENQILEYDARLADSAQRTQELFHALESAKERINAIGGDGAVARLEGQRRTCLEHIQDSAREYARTIIGIEAAEHALRAYRDAHRTSMMKRASEAFRLISRGAYSRLDTQLTEIGEVLIGIAANGGTKIASQMSKGARFQLYLSLRVAGYLEFVDHHGPVPFIADDILETSDDFRAREVFSIFAEMAKVGQIIYLGHHRHLCEIALGVCPDVRIHELPDPVVTTNQTGERH